MRQLGLIAVLVALAGVFGTPSKAQMVSDLPKSVVKMSGVVPGMGEHWMDPKDRARGGPVYGVMNNKIVFIEFEILKKDLTGDKEISWHYPEVPDFIGKIDHVDVEYLPKGHRNMEVPHLTIHLYTVPHEQHLAYKPQRR